MKIGAFIRRLFGPHERSISELYRAIYLDVDALLKQTQNWKANALRILEVGCGEGAVTQRLRAAYPEAEITAIDISPRVGRLYCGPTAQLQFVQCDVEDIASRKPASFDLVVLSDVLHHVPAEARQGLLEGIRTALAPHGTFVFKDWEKSRSPIHWLCHASDRWLTGDRVVYMSGDEMREKLKTCFGCNALIAEARIRPWWNNLAVAVRT